MEASPLTQQSRPDTFKPKIVQLYEDLFQVRHNPIFILTQFRKKKKRKRKIILIYHLQTSDSEPSEGFWREFFLLTPDRDQLHAVLERLSPDTTLSLQVLNPPIHEHLLDLSVMLTFGNRFKLSSSLLVQSGRLLLESAPLMFLHWR